MPSRVGLEFVLRGRGAPSPTRQGDAFRVLLVADFGGRARVSSDKPDLAAPLRVDAVDFEKAFARFEPRLTVTTPSGVVEHLNLASLDDLHPDHLFENLELFAVARELRRALAAGGNAQVFERARSWLHEQGAVGSLPEQLGASATTGVGNRSISRYCQRSAIVSSPAMPDDNALTKASSSGTARKLVEMARRTSRSGRSIPIRAAAASSNVTSAWRNR